MNFDLVRKEKVEHERVRDSIGFKKKKGVRYLW